MGTRGSKKRKASRGAGVSKTTEEGFSISSGGRSSVSRPGMPCLVLPGKTSESARIFSLADWRFTPALALDPTHVILGTSGSWLVTADKLARMHLVNPVTGEHAKLPDITTIMGIQYEEFSYNLDLRSLMQTVEPKFRPRWELVRPQSFTFAAHQMREYFYRKVVLSSSPNTSKYAAMLILERGFGSPAFATEEKLEWRLASLSDSVEDAIHYNDQFYSITYSGVVHVWKHDTDADKMTSKVVQPSLLLVDQDNMVEAIPRLTENYSSRHKYLVAGLDGQLMVVEKYSQEVWSKWRCYFKVYVLDGEVGGMQQWEESQDIGTAVLFVGLNNSLCVSTIEHPEFKAGCIYFTDDELEHAQWRTDERNRYLYKRRGFQNRCVGVYNLKKSKLEKVRWPMEQPSFWPPAAWFMPSFAD